MTPKFDKIHNRFKLNGIHFDAEGLKEASYSFVKEGEPFEKEIGNFLMDWLNEKDHLFIQTSGSTGQPKIIKINKQAMVNSAISTGNFFKLKPGDKALHCLPSYYVAGKMMLVRAMILGLEIDCVAPVTQLNFNQNKSYQFSAMIPLQVQKSINQLQRIETVIIGGAKIPQAVLKNIEESNTKFYETYGMTETVTHVAIKKLDSKALKGETNFKALEHVTFSKDDRDCLIIKAPNLSEQELITNDIVDLILDTEFRWLGRHDNVINSGGVKLFPEQIENKLQNVIKEPFILASEEDQNLGEKLVLIIENPSENNSALKAKIEKIKGLNKFEKPKNIYSIKKFSRTKNGKLQRKKIISEALG